MLKHSLLFIFLLVNLSAGDKVEIYASKMDSKENVVNATGGVSVLYGEYFLTSDSAVYDRDSEELELFGHVRVNQGISMKILGKYAKMNIAKKERLFKPFYMTDKKSRVWLSSGEAEAEDKNINIESGILSGCNPVDPIWKMEFSSTDYNSDTKWLNIYNARLYVGDILVFYSPYFGYSSDNTRRTGLLMPSVGFSADEGIYYEQPIYIAEQNWWDLELRPQIRTRRGSGLYQSFRFVESPTARGEFTAGYFKEKEEYFKERKLANDKHYGFKFEYANTDFLNDWFGLNTKGQSGIYTDANYMNDVDYINLSKRNTINTTTATQLLSMLNLFYNGENQYVGTYFKYYQNLTQASNTETVQKLPTLQYHYYLESLLQDYILYNLDVQANNLTRVEGTTVVQTDANLPITVQTNLFNEYLNISYVANVYMQHSSFERQPLSISTNELNDGYMLRNDHTLAASTQLTRGFEKITHVMNFEVSYNKGGTELKNGYYEENADLCEDPTNKANPRCEFYNINSVKEEAQIDFIEYLYDEDTEEFFYHHLAQRISYDEIQTKFSELENELNYKITKNITLYNDMLYTYDENKLSKIYNQIAVNTESLDVTISHLYKNEIRTNILTSYVISSATYRYDSHYTFKAIYNYDTLTKEPKNKELGFMYKKRCWDFGLRYSENRRPVLTTTGDSFIDDKYIYLTLVLKPLMQANDGSLITYQLLQND
jgi:LPS-assembly protein